VGKWPEACVEIVDELWVTQLIQAKYAGQMRFCLCIKVFFNISFVEISKESQEMKKPAELAGLIKLI
jgi:hypothetical protein